jgi:ABC-type multidrug transport system ATPase subunit
LDEPTNGMDPQGIFEMREFLKKLRKEQGISILISSHILSELEQLATKYGIINKGVLIDEFTSEELVRKNASSIIVSVNNIEKAKEILTKNFSPDVFEIANGKITVVHQIDFSKINKTLVLADIDVVDITKCQSNLEKYFIDTVSGQEKA